METIDPQVAAEFTAADVIELWLHRQPSPLTRSAYQRDIRSLRSWTAKGLSQTTVLDLEGFAVALSKWGFGEHFGWAYAGCRPEYLSLCRAIQLLHQRSCGN